MLVRILAGSSVAFFSVRYNSQCFISNEWDVENEVLMRYKIRLDCSWPQWRRFLLRQDQTIVSRARDEGFWCSCTTSVSFDMDVVVSCTSGCVSLLQIKIKVKSMHHSLDIFGNCWSSLCFFSNLHSYGTFSNKTSSHQRLLQRNV